MAKICSKLFFFFFFVCVCVIMEYLLCSNAYLYDLTLPIFQNNLQV
jgi:hypothetical protein